MICGCIQVHMLDVSCPLLIPGEAANALVRIGEVEIPGQRRQSGGDSFLCCLLPEAPAG